MPSGGPTRSDSRQNGSKSDGTAAGQQVIGLLASLAADGTAVVIVTHDPAVAAAMDRRVVMRDGRIVSDGRVTH